MFVEIIFAEDMLVLRSRNSELLILPNHIKNLQNLKNSKEFSEYFLQKSLVNRAARKLFVSWLKKDNTVWPRLYSAIHKQSGEKK